jgi:hypothetical protein
MTWHTVAGMTEKVWLPDDILFEVKLIPVGQTNQRPGYALWQPPNWIAHETGNPRVGANADMHSVYLDNGALAVDPETGKTYSQQLGYHFTVDDHKVVQKLPVNEISWQAADGAGPGNYQCISCEQCINADGNEAKARHNHEALAAGVMAAKGRTAANVGRHWDYNYLNAPAYRHHCPDHMMTEGYWPTFVSNVATNIDAIRAMMATTPDVPAPPAPAPEPQNAPAVLPDWFTKQDALEHPTDQKWQGRTAYVAKRNYKALAGTLRRAEPKTDAPKAGPNVAKGEKVFGIRLWVNPDDKRTWILEETGTWLLASKFSPRVRIDPRTVD